ncbi:cytochrome c3 family protein [Candidatus Poribacteria bacterium]|nr:cytochrome c3 family protein [Candidatus Poribacteria bacterium]
MRLARHAAVAAAVFIVALVSAPAFAATSEDCFACHDDPSLVNAQDVSLRVDPKAFKESVHGQKGIECVDCHAALSDVKDFPHDAPVAKVDCSTCHSQEAEDYKASIHGKGFAKNDPSVPVCSTCHGKHDIRPPEDPQSSVNPLNLVAVCIKCHADTKIVAEHHLPPLEKIKAYESSVHMKALREKGLTVSAACNDCHGAHKIMPPDDPDSTANRFNIPETCAKCHQGIYQTYIESVHGQDYLKKNKDVPICTDCHGEHSIKSHESPDSAVYATHIAEICSKCHEDESLGKRYGFAAKRLKTYLGTYHGIASKMGDIKVANCASCHGYHDIRPPNDPRSSVHPDNIPKTCGKCHPQAGKNFAIGKVHVSEARESSMGAFVVERFYTIFIVANISGFIIFIMVDLYARRRKAKTHKRQTASDLEKVSPDSPE